MVVSEARVVRFLAGLHATPAGAGIDATLRAHPELGLPRSLYRWQNAYGAQLKYFPNVAYSALGLRTMHLLITNPRGPWESFQYAVAGKWCTNGTARQLYLRCLVPEEHVHEVQERLTDAADKSTIEVIMTDDLVQTFHGTTPQHGDPLDARQLLATEPLIIPVLAELTESRTSIPELWERIHSRLQDRIRQYVPTRRVWVTNGKHYVHATLTALTRALVLHEHVVRFAPLEHDTIEVLLHSTDAEALLRLGAISIDSYQINDEHALHAVRLTLPVFKQLLQLPTITILSITDDLLNAQAPLQCRFRYETLHDPRKGWRQPASLFAEDNP